MNDGGPAFPAVEFLPGVKHGQGMSLRDYFADTALRRTMKEFGTGNENSRAVAARVAYEMADAMLVERAK